ncbi:MAG: hypothetical protein D6702_11200 [Planctomycetota bacterium]|nr:MAG: hypothetical protein D6702_11200 [Planctomycetota bacterium]
MVKTKAAAERRLAALYRRNGCIRLPNRERCREEGPARYKKGYEVRLTANDRAELKEIPRLLELAGYRAGKPHAKGNRWRIPVYGREAVDRFLAMVRRCR